MPDIQLNFDILEERHGGGPIWNRGRSGGGPSEFIVQIRSLEKKINDYELLHAFPPEISAKAMVPDILRSQIVHDSGIPAKYIKVNKKWRTEDQYVVSVIDPGHALMFKMIYYGEKL